MSTNIFSVDIVPNKVELLTKPRLHLATFTNRASERSWTKHSNKDTEIEIHLDVESLFFYWQTCGLAITAGGNTLFERIASGIPGATICQLQRQMEIANSFENFKVNLLL